MDILSFFEKFPIKIFLTDESFTISGFKNLTELEKTQMSSFAKEHKPQIIFELKYQYLCKQADKVGDFMDDYKHIPYQDRINKMPKWNELCKQISELEEQITIHQ